MRWNDAILISLKEINKPATYNEVFEHIKKNKYYNWGDAKTPNMTVGRELGQLSEKPDSGIKRIKEQTGGSYLYFISNGSNHDFHTASLNSVEKSTNDFKKSEANQNEPENNNSEESDGVEPEEEELQPFDPEKISIDTKPTPMDTCLRRLEQGTIILAPDFQRNEVWDIKQKSRLIESIMLKIPIPMFYVASDEKGVYSVVDGLQRLSTIRSFVLGDEYLEKKDRRYKGEGFKLKYLEFWGERYNNRNFNSLSADMQNRILETVFTFTIINPGTPEDVKRNVFKRINTGGAPLAAQEIRHALYSGKSTQLLLRLSKLPEFLNATNNSVKDKRMMDRELILRFMSFSIRDWEHYPKSNDMDTFLCDTMRIINMTPELTGNDSKKLFPNEEDKKVVLIKNVNKMEILFTKAMIRAKNIFGEHTFRKSYGGKNKSPINKALFEVWSVLLSKLTEFEFAILLKNKNEFLSKYNPLLNEIIFSNSISRDSWKFSGVKYRYEALSKLLNEFIHD